MLMVFNLIKPGKGFATGNAAVPPLPPVAVQVLCQVTFLCERLGAHWAAEWSLTGMYPHVPL